MATFPSNLSYGTVTGQFILAYADSNDVGSEPDVVPAQGSIFFTPSPTVIKDVTSSPNAVTLLPATVEATLDADGYLCGYGTTQGIILVATDDPQGQPVDWTWKAEFRLTDASGTAVPVQPFSFELPGGSTVDLTIASPVPDANGTYYSKGDKGDAGADATIAIGTVTTGAAGSSATVTNSGTSNAAVFDFSIPQGAKGDTGNTGPANTLSIGTVTSDTTPSATITGTAPNQTLNLVLAKGDTGATGPAGADGAGVEPGGTTNQLLAKASNADYDTQWVDAPNAANGIPTGGAQYTMLVKNSSTDYDTSWTNTIDGGTA